MHSDDLSFFALVADAGSVSAAALTLGCDTSTLSRRITQLETRLGVRLFHRSGRGMSLTAQGQTLRGYARQVTALLEEAEAAVSRDAEHGPQAIRIAAQPTIAKVLFGDLFHALRERFPRSRIHFTEALASSILAGLHAGEVDVAVLYRPEFTGSVVYEPLLSEQLYLVVPPSQALPQASLAVSALADHPLVLPSTHHGLRVMVDALCARHGFAPRVALECDSSIAMTLQLVHQGCGSTVLPLAAAAQDIAQGRLKACPLQGPEAQRCVALVVGKTPIHSRALWVLNGIIRDLAHRMVASGGWPGAQWLADGVMLRQPPGAQTA
ncbi:LysR family transcriptional regulator [Diaphorobacter sp. J5-51]|uniref:LysR family transcriptional regulator n=1 Tax=Diaphorobacter sp. J5-51 TaxID=680496 RepID=UPI000643177A|nr:LysR family transcriptional regulator [Diaphorobacter sp. J5-51]